MSEAQRSILSCGSSALLTWTGVRIQHRDPLLTSFVLEEAFLRPVVTRAGQSGQIDQEWYSVQGCLRWEVEIEAHLAVRGRGIVCQFEELAAERGDCCFGLNGHCWRDWMEIWLLVWPEDIVGFGRLMRLRL